MGKHYDQLDLDDRIEISRLQTAGRSRREIGRLAITRNGVKFGL
jgi:IS30 family transposase